MNRTVRVQGSRCGHGGCLGDKGQELSPLPRGVSHHKAAAGCLVRENGGRSGVQGWLG